LAGIAAVRVSVDRPALPMGGQVVPARMLAVDHSDFDAGRIGRDGHFQI